MSAPRERFQNLLRKLFQFDAADLDFGIYRILNQKRAVIEDFIERGLLTSIDHELSKGPVGQQMQALSDLAGAAAAVRSNLGEEAIAADGTLVEVYADTPLGQHIATYRVSHGGSDARPP